MGAALMAMLLLAMSGGGFAQAAEAIEVTNNNDSGDGSLRKAIEESSTGDTITFADDVTGAILLESQLVIDKDLTIEGPSVERELALVKVTGSGEKRVESLRIADIFRARVLDSTSESFVFEIIGDTGKLNAIIDLMKPLGLVDVSRTGVVAIARGNEAL